jgi:hypothetical protein
MKLTGTIVSALLLAFAAAGCDASKAELEKTKLELHQVTADRDSLKSQLETADSKINSCQSEVIALKAAAAKAAEPKAAEKPATKAAKKKTASKHHRRH